MKLFLTAFLQVFFVSANTYFLANSMYAGVAICGFAISWLWAGNVRKVSIGSKADRFIYSIGTMLGGLTGLFLATWI